MMKAGDIGYAMIQFGLIRKLWIPDPDGMKPDDCLSYSSERLGYVNQLHATHDAAYRAGLQQLADELALIRGEQRVLEQQVTRINNAKQTLLGQNTYPTDFSDD